MERCPNCRARDGGQAHCHRCGMELQRLRQLEAQAEAWERLAVQRLLQGDRIGAGRAAAQALARQRRPLARVLRRFAQGETQQSAPPGEAALPDG